MVNRETFAYLLCGRDIIALDGSSRKDLALKQIKEKFLPLKSKEFNLDTLYAKELDLKGLQEKLLYLPAQSKQRVVIIKACQNLKENIKSFIIEYLKKPHPWVVLVLDADSYSPKDEFIRDLGRHARVIHFDEKPAPDTFSLSRSIESKRAPYALQLLNQLLVNGEKPERILGGLRYTWEKSFEPQEVKKRKLKLLLACDIDIKTGRLKPLFALEKLVVNLCGLGKPFR